MFTGLSALNTRTGTWAEEGEEDEEGEEGEDEDEEGEGLGISRKVSRCVCEKKRPWTTLVYLSMRSRKVRMCAAVHIAWWLGSRESRRDKPV
jgi:hypothetical protein